MNENSYLELLRVSLVELLLKYRRNPYYYFYEEDIRVELARLLIDKFSTIKVEHSQNIITTSPVKCEYPSTSDNKKRHDIVIVNQNGLKDIYNLDLSVIIELKLGSKSYDRCSEFKEDIIKILGYDLNIKLGIALYFYQDEINHSNFLGWFSDIINEFILVDIEKLTLEPNCLNTFIITPSQSVLKAISYKSG